MKPRPRSQSYIVPTTVGPENVLIIPTNMTSFVVVLILGHPVYDIDHLWYNGFWSSVGSFYREKCCSIPCVHHLHVTQRRVVRCPSSQTPTAHSQHVFHGFYVVLLKIIQLNAIGTDTALLHVKRKHNGHKLLLECLQTIQGNCTHIA